ncbi:MAG: hypothetical protein M0R38_12195 [Bacteroidia bacterium]|nr:hypothetical protein [Bacteroidia bacterium]
MSKYFIHYSQGTNHDNADDVAIVRADSKREAVEKFKEWYTNATDKTVQPINTTRKGFAKGIMIIGNY